MKSREQAAADAWLKAVAEESGSKIEQSDTFMVLYSKNFREDPRCALQLGIAILLNKPILVLAEQGIEVPPGLNWVARGVERYSDKGSLEAAAKRLLALTKEKS